MTPLSQDYNLFGVSLNAAQPVSAATSTVNSPGAVGLTSTPVSDPTLPSSILSGSMNAQVNLVTGFLQSSDFVSGSTGWQINSNGNVEFNNGVFRGTITATTGSIGGWSIGLTTITSNTGNVVLDSAGNIRFGKTGFSDSTNAGLIMGLNGATPTFYLGTALDASYVKLSGGVYDMVGTVSGRSTLTISTAINSSGNLVTDVINARLDSSAKNILSDFNFGTVDYAGAVKSGSITWNTTTGAITGGSGVVVYRGGIVGANSGVSTFTLDAITGNATFSGTVTAGTGSTVVNSFTAGEDLSAGDVVSLTSSSTVKRSTITGVNTQGSTSTRSDPNLIGGSTRMIALDMDSTHKVVFYSNGINTALTCMVITVSPSGETITSSSRTAILSVSENNSKIDAKKIDSDNVLLCWDDVEGTSVKAAVIGTVTTGTPTAGAVVTVAAATSQAIQCDFFDSTNDVLFLYQDTSSGNVFKLRQYTRSGTTLTAGTTSTVFTGSASCTLKGFRRFGSTAYFGFVWDDTTNTTGKIAAALYDHASLSFSSVGSSASFTSSDRIDMSDMYGATDGTTMVIGYQRTTSRKVVCATRSSVTMTVQTPLSLTNANTSSQAFTFTTLNDREFAVGGALVASNLGLYNIVQVNKGSATLTETINYTINNHGNAAWAAYLNPKAIISVIYDGTTPTWSFNVTTLNNTYLTYVGIVTADANNASSVSVNAQGSQTINGLTAATTYFTDMGGLPTSSNTRYNVNDISKIGQASTTTTLIVQT